jgi:hypothetical protein
VRERERKKKGQGERDREREIENRNAWSVFMQISSETPENLRVVCLNK